METKICRLCNEEKNLTEYYFVKNRNKYRSECKKCFYLMRKEYYKIHKDTNRKSCKKYYEKNKKMILEMHKRYNERDKNKLKQQVRTSIRYSFKRKKCNKPNKTEKIIGCSFEVLYEHLLQTYKENYGFEWDGVETVHIDHITPLATAHSEEEIIKLCHYTNLQLLKAKDNLEKNDKLNWNIKKLGGDL